MTEEKGLLAACICGDADCRMWLEHGHAETTPDAPASAVEALREAILGGVLGISGNTVTFEAQSRHDADLVASSLEAALTAQAHPAGDDGEWADLLTKAVGDITAALTLAGKEEKIRAWTAPYIAAINQADAHPRPDEAQGQASNWFVGDEDADGNELITVRKDEWDRLHTLAHPAPASDAGEFISIPRLNSVYAEDHPLLAPIIEKRGHAAGDFSIEFSGQRGEDFDRGILAAYNAVKDALAALSTTGTSQDQGERA